MEKELITPLCHLGAKYASDKSPLVHHSYTPYYYEIMNPVRKKVKKFFEIGIGFPETMFHMSEEWWRKYKPGASFFMWQDFFPNAQIYGCDIKPEVMIKEDRIETFICDQADSGKMCSLVEKIGGEFDFIVDDGSHVVDHQIISAIALFPYLTSDGVYIIEDVKKEHVEKITCSLNQMEVSYGVHRFNEAGNDDILISITK